MINYILFAGGLSFVSYLFCLIGRCSAIHDLCDGRVCDDLESFQKSEKYCQLTGT